MNKAWSVGPYDDDWVIIVHTETRAKARVLGTAVEFHEYIGMRAIRIPELDDISVTKETLLNAGWPEECIDEPFDPSMYTFMCECENCNL